MAKFDVGYCSLLSTSRGLRSYELQFRLYSTPPLALPEDNLHLDLNHEVLADPRTFNAEPPVCLPC